MQLSGKKQDITKLFNSVWAYIGLTYGMMIADLWQVQFWFLQVDASHSNFSFCKATSFNDRFKKNNNSQLQTTYAIVSMWAAISMALVYHWEAFDLAIWPARENCSRKKNPVEN